MWLSTRQPRPTADSLGLMSEIVIRSEACVELKARGDFRICLILLCHRPLGRSYLSLLSNDILIGWSDCTAIAGGGAGGC